MSLNSRPPTAPDPRTTAHRGLAALTSLAVAVPIALVVTAGPVGADETPAPVRVTATTRVDAEIFATDPALGGEPTFVTTTVDGVDGAAVSNQNWSTGPPAVGTSFSCDPTGCAGYDGRALAEADEAEGILRAGAIAHMYIGNPPKDGYGIAGYIFSTGDALIEDTITLAAPATVVLTGRLSGLLSATNTDSEEQGNDPEGVVLAQVQFLGERAWNGEGLRPPRPGWHRPAVRGVHGRRGGGGRDVQHPDRPAGRDDGLPRPPLRRGRLPDLRRDRRPRQQDGDARLHQLPAVRDRAARGRHRDVRLGLPAADRRRARGGDADRHHPTGGGAGRHDGARRPVRPEHPSPTRCR